MQQIARAVAMAFNTLPRTHRVLLGSLTVVTLAVSVWRPYVYHPSSESPIVKAVELDKNELRTLLPEASEPIDQDVPLLRTISPKMKLMKMCLTKRVRTITWSLRGYVKQRP